MIQTFWKDNSGVLYRGEVLEVLKELPAESVSCMITSPPYYGLRDYGVKGQLGLEETYQEFLSKLWAIFDEMLQNLNYILKICKAKRY